MRDPNRNVTFAFKCYEKESVDLKIRLKYDCLQQNQFFESVLRMYISNNPLMLDVVEYIKEKEKIMGKKRIKNSKKELLSGQEKLRDLALSDEEKENVFDVIEFDLGDEYEE